MNGTNKPCPAGYRVPTEADWEAERLGWSSYNSAGTFNSVLKLPVSGYRLYGSGSLFFVGSSGGYWTSTINAENAQRLGIGSSGASVTGYQRAKGVSVCCIRDRKFQ